MPKISEKSLFTFWRGASILRRGAIALPWRHPCSLYTLLVNVDIRRSFVQRAANANSFAHNLFAPGHVFSMLPANLKITLGILKKDYRPTTIFILQKTTRKEIVRYKEFKQNSKLFSTKVLMWNWWQNKTFALPHLMWVNEGNHSQKKILKYPDKTSHWNSSKISW